MAKREAVRVKMLSTGAISKELGVHPNTITTWLRRSAGQVNPFPAADLEVPKGDQVTRFWLPERLPELKTWAAQNSGRVDRPKVSTVIAGHDVAKMVTTSDLGKELGGVTSLRVVTWIDRAAGTDHEFPPPDLVVEADTGDIRLWSRSRLPEIRKWNASRRTTPGTRAGVKRPDVAERNRQRAKSATKKDAPVAPKAGKSGKKK